MSAVSSVLAGVVATVAAAVTVPLLWVSVNVQDEDGYVELSSALATDPELQGAVAGYLADDFARRGIIPGTLQDTAAQVMTAAAGATSSSPDFAKAWEGTQRSLHASALDDQASGPLVVDLGPLATFVVDRAGDRLPIDLQADVGLLVPIGTEQDRERIAPIGQAQTWALVGLMIVLAAAGASILAARSRALALAGLGVGALAVAGALRAVLGDVVPRVIDAGGVDNAFAQTLQKLLVERAADSLNAWLLPLAVIGGGAVVVGGIGHAIRRLTS